MNTKHTLVFLFCALIGHYMQGQDNKITVGNDNDDKVVEIYGGSNDDGVIELFDSDGTSKLKMYGNLTESGGKFELNNNAGQTKIEMETVGSNDDVGKISLFGPLNNESIRLSYLVNNGGGIAVYNKDGDQRIALSGLDRYGNAVLHGRNSTNIILGGAGSLIGEDLGKISVHNEDGKPTAEMQSHSAWGNLLFSDTSGQAIAQMGGLGSAISSYGFLRLVSADRSEAVRAGDQLGHGYLRVYSDSANTSGQDGNLVGDIFSDETANGNGRIDVYAKNDEVDPRISFFVPNYDAGEFNLTGPNGSRNIGMGVPDIPNANYGWFGLYDDNDQSRIRMLPLPENNGSGVIQTFGTNGSLNTWMGADPVGHDQMGYIAALDHNNTPWASMYISQTGFGYVQSEIIQTIGANVWIANDANGGRVELNANAKMYVDGNGMGTIEADVKNFSMPHPVLEDKKIVYACIEGPEAAAYARGTAQLTNGKAIIQLPDHFTLVAAEEGMTVILTPLSADSKGLAVTRKSLKGITVQEMFSGTGDYEFDWEVKSIRKGFEDYKVIRDNDGPMQPYRDPNLKVKKIPTLMGQRE